MLSLAAVLAIAGIAVFATMAFVFSIGTATVDVPVEVTAVDAATGSPLPACLLVFETGPGGRTGYGRTTARTDAEGRLGFSTSHQFTASPLMPWRRERNLVLRFYVGAAPRPDGRPEEVETWELTLAFREPWFERHVDPTTRLQLQLSRDESYVGSFGPRTAVASRQITTPDPEGRASSRVDFEGRAWRIRLVVRLDERQAAACRSQPPS